MANAIYKVMVVSNNSWHTDGSAIIEKECDHNHRTLSGAFRCLRELNWFGSEIRHSDESPLTDIEIAALDTIMWELEGSKWS